MSNQVEDAPVLSPAFEPRHEERFPTLTPEDVARLRRYGEVRAFDAEARLATTGDVGHGVLVILSGRVEVTQHDGTGRSEIIITYGPGQFLGELAQLSGQPSLVDAVARGPVETIVIPSRRLRELFAQESGLGERIMRALILRRVSLLRLGAGGPIILGHNTDGAVLRLSGFLARNGHPHRALDPDSDPGAKALLEKFHIDPQSLPIVICPNGQLLRNPTDNALARCLGLIRPLDASVIYDVAIIGAGPAGLAAAVYAASEGLSVLVLDCRAFGGQAGASSRIENYLGFPTGISGLALMARANNQAKKFGAEIAIPDEVASLENTDDLKAPFTLRLANAESTRARSIIVASGARYRRLAIDNLSDFEDGCVHYWASPSERTLCADEEAVLVGGGNSAGQAAVFLAEKVKKLWLVVRRDLSLTMSRYLVDRIKSLPNISVLTRTEICGLQGKAGVLDVVRWRNLDTGEEAERTIHHLFLFIGAEPNTDWLAGSGVALDKRGFVLTGLDAAVGRAALETSKDGIFAIGDVRLGSVKRVAAAVGEGAQVVAALHGFLATRPQ